jgi:glyoxylase-like metal-dependent hydrolase (beta-lactamase superfamily II)
MFFGDYRVEIIPDCNSASTAAMFGVVLRDLWSRLCPPDDQNRIRMNMNCLFIEGGANRFLSIPGLVKWPDKHPAMYGIDRLRSFDESRAIAGIGSSEITIVINTHLHFDHAGGNSLMNEGRAVRRFPKRDTWCGASTSTQNLK